MKSYTCKLVVSVYGDLVVRDFCDAHDLRTCGGHRLEHHSDFNRHVGLKIRTVNISYEFLVVFSVSVFCLKYSFKFVSRISA